MSMTRLTGLILWLALLLPLPVAAAPSCHCFQERSFDPANPGAIEPYLLATCHNSLLSVTFDLPKRQIVQQLMSGTSATDLWLSQALAPALASTPEELLKARPVHPSWARLAAARGFDPEQLDPRLLAEIAAGRSDEALTDRVVLQQLARGYGLPIVETLPLLDAGLSRKELVLAAYLSLRNGTALQEVVRSARSLPGGWGELTLRSGLDPKEFMDGWARFRIDSR